MNASEIRPSEAFCVDLTALSAKPPVPVKLAIRTAANGVLRDFQPSRSYGRQARPSQLNQRMCEAEESHSRSRKGSTIADLLLILAAAHIQERRSLSAAALCKNFVLHVIDQFIHCGRNHRAENGTLMTGLFNPYPRSSCLETGDPLANREPSLHTVRSHHS